MKILYHGTTLDNTDIIVGPPHAVDVSLGRGELGQGFYMGEEVCLIGVWARAKAKKRKDTPSVLRFELREEEILQLDTKSIGKRSLVLSRWRGMFKTTIPFLYNVDLVIAPFAILEFSHQYKFESLKAQNLLNSSTIKKIL